MARSCRGSLKVHCRSPGDPEGAYDTGAPAAHSSARTPCMPFPLKAPGQTHSGKYFQ